MLQELSLRLRGRVGATVLMLLVGYAAGSASRQSESHADVRRRDAQKPQHFQSGAQRSEALLKNISATLTSIDGRLERLESSAKRWSQLQQTSHEAGGGQR